MKIDIRDTAGNVIGNWKYRTEPEMVTIPGYEMLYFICYKHVCMHMDCEQHGVWYLAEFTTGCIVAPLSKSKDELILNAILKFDALEEQHGDGYVTREILKMSEQLNG